MSDVMEERSAAVQEAEGMLESLRSWLKANRSVLDSPDDFDEALEILDDAVKAEIGSIEESLCHG